MLMGAREDPDAASGTFGGGSDHVPLSRLARTLGNGVAYQSASREPKRLGQTTIVLDEKWDGGGEAPESPRSDGAV